MICIADYPASEWPEILADMNLAELEEQSEMLSYRTLIGEDVHTTYNAKSRCELEQNLRTM